MQDCTESGTHLLPFIVSKRSCKWRSLQVGGDVLVCLEDEEGLARVSDLHVERSILIVDLDVDLGSGVAGQAGSAKRRS